MRIGSITEESSPFLIAPSGDEFYVNVLGDSDFSDNQYTSAPGDNGHSGKRPDAPMASFLALLKAYDIGAGDVIYVDSGTYDIIDDIRLSASNSGITITGPTDADKSAVIDRGNKNNGADVFELSGVSNVTISHLTISGGHHGIRLAQNTGNANVTIRDNRLANNSWGVRAYSGNSNITIAGNEVRGNSRGISAQAIPVVIADNRVFFNGWGIDASDSVSTPPGTTQTIVGNEVFGNSDYGIYARGYRTLVSENAVYQNRATGIAVVSGGRAVANEVYENSTGIYSFEDSDIVGNQIYSNTFGIWSNNTEAYSPGWRSAEYIGNSIYSNRYGIYLAPGLQHPVIRSNLIYDNSTRAIDIDGWDGNRSHLGTIDGNTIHHVGSSAIRIANTIDISIENNVFSIEDGVAIEVTTTNPALFESDYNLFDLRGSSQIAQWSGSEISTLLDWKANFGFDVNSFESDPLFVDSNGEDDQLGSSTIVPVQVVDNGDPGFSQQGEWNLRSGDGFDGDYLTGRWGRNNVATWTIDDLTPGKLYRLAVTFVPIHLSTARYTISDDNGVLGTVTYSQGSHGSESTFNGTRRHFEADDHVWTRLGSYQPSGTQLTVSMTGVTYQGRPEWFPSADAVRIDEIVADSNNDDDFHLSATSPAIDRADPTADFAAEPTPNGSRRNLGAYGNTSEATSSGARSIRVNSPFGGEKWIAGVTYPVQFDSDGLNESVSIDVSIDDGATWTEIATDVAVDVDGIGSFDWTIAESFVATDDTALIRARSGSGRGISPGSFQITPPRGALETPFYINLADDTDFSDNQYTTAVGTNRNSGRSPDRPMASLVALMRAYDLEPGDVVYVDSGNYSLISNIVIFADDSGVTITGPTETDKSAVINRGTNVDGTAVFQILGASNVTISNLGISGARVGIQISGSGSSQIAVEDNDIFSNRHAGIEAGPGNPNITVRRNEIHDNSTYGVLASAEDMLVQSNRILSNRYGVHAANLVDVRDNDVTANTDFGIYVADSGPIAAGNRVWGHDVGSSTTWEGGVGIYSLGTVVGNIVYDNGTGIVGVERALVQSNRIYGNNTGVRNTGGFGVRIVSNTIYSNSRGVLVNSDTAILTNLVYDNTNSAVTLEDFYGGLYGGSGLFAGNTVFHAVGDAISIVSGSQNVRVYNNIISVDNGSAIAVEPGSAAGFESNYNLVHLGTGTSANYGEFSGVVTPDLASWQAATGTAINSVEDDPLFVDPAGIDNLLGFVDGVDYGQDDNWVLAKDSPAIDAGDIFTATPTDYLGSERRNDPGTINTGSIDYTESSIEVETYSLAGTPLNLTNSGFAVARYTLPFAFPYFGIDRTEVEVSNQGLLQFGSSANMQWSVDAESRLLTESFNRITAMWQDIHTGGTEDGVLVDDTVADQVTIHWNATASATDADVHFAITLHRSGDFEFHYGTTGDLPPVAGYSNRSAFLIARDAASNGYDSGLGDTKIRFGLMPGYTDIGALEFRGDSQDDIAPFIASASPAAMSVGGTTNDTIDSFEIIFNEEVNFFDALSFAAYDLREAGSNETFGDGDDTIYEVTPSFALGNSSVNLTLDSNALLSTPIESAGSSGAPLATSVAGDELQYYLPEGNYRFELKSDPTGGIRDTAGLSIDGDGDNMPGGSFVQEFQVHFTPEYLTLDVTPSVSEGETATLTGRFRDLSGGDSFTLLVDWGDGTPVQSTPIPDGQTAFSLTHLYVNDSLAEEGGQFQVTTTLANNLGRQTLNDDQPLTVTVENLAPTIDTLQIPTAVDEAETFSISGTFTELGTNDEFVLSIDWGHGPVETIPLAAGSSHFDVTHTYTEIPSRVAPIDQVVTVSLSDGAAGSIPIVKPIQLTTLNAPPKISGQTFKLVEHSADATIVGQVVNSDPDLITPNEDTQAFRIVGGSGFGLYEIDAAGIIRVTDSEAIDYEDTASHSLFVEVTDGRGETDLALISVDLQNLTEIDSMLIDDGTSQRSMVRSIVIRFDALVSLESDAIQIETDTGQIIQPMVETAYDRGKSIATLTFSGQHVGVGGSLEDGNYRLRIDHQKVIPVSAEQMSSDHVDSFFRLFGDSDGDRDVDGQDYGNFGLTFHQLNSEPAFDSRFDSDGDGDVDGQDYGEFRRRFQRSLPF